MCTRILAVLTLLVSVLLPLRAADTLLITEFMASNLGPLADENGDYSDWIELHNPGTNTVNADGWFLTDSAANLIKWRLPATNIAPNGYLIVFASGKNRAVPGKELHANFSLNANGEYLGLIRPDGVTVASQYAPTFPAQVARVSYGIPVQQTTATLLTAGAAARVYVPTNDALAGTWVIPGFDDSAWLSAVTGVGYERDSQGVFTPVTLADSVTEFSGTQGSNNWYYGYWDRKADPNGVYSDLDMSFFPNVSGAYGSNNYWNGSAWVWFNGNPPFTQLTASGGNGNAPNGLPTREDHWAVRRYVSEAGGLLKITGQVTHTSDWVYVTATGVQANSLLYLYLTAAGDGYLDDMKLVAGSVPEAGANLLPGGDFEGTLTPPWTVSANHFFSGLDTTVKHGGASSLHIVATNGGTTQASAIWQDITPALTAGATYTLSYWFKPGTNNTPLTTRFSGNWITASPSGCGDGVTGRIFVDGGEVFQQGAYLGSANYNITVPVSVGSRVDFIIDPRTNDLCDNAVFTAHIETADPTLVVANSVTDWSFTGTQGENNWYYGYYNKSADVGGVYAASDFVAFPRSTASFGPLNYWTGTLWDWPNGNPPWDTIGQTAMHPNGSNNVAEHWTIRRWVSEVSGRITVDWTLAKTDANGSGVSGRVFLNGTEVDSVSIAGNNTAGVSRSVVVTNVQIGDFLDVALTPVGLTGDPTDGSDSSAMTVVVRGVPTLTSAVASNIESAMYGVNASAYIRIPFTVTNVASINFLNLRMKYDDGFVAYLNGVNVASRNALSFENPVTWSSAATTNRFDGDVNQGFESIDITSFKGLLQEGTNVLAIQGLNASAVDSDFLILPELQTVNVAFGNAGGYFAGPTPGAANGAASTNLGPIVASATHLPDQPRDNDNIVVTASVFPTFNSISNVQMIYRVNFSNEVTAAMFDDGLHGDGAAGDGVYGATIPATASNPGEMVRYYISATDTRSNRTRFPTFDAPLDSPEYLGTVIYLPQTNNLPMLHWFIANPTGANTDVGTRCSVYYNGQFFDNVGVTLHGQSSASFPKHSHNFNLNSGYKLEVSPDRPKLSDFAIISTWADRSHLRVPLNTEIYTNAGTPAHYTFPMRVQQNGTFFCVTTFSEQGNDKYLERIGYDPDGSLYKMYTTFDANIAANEKKTRKYEGNADLQAFYNAIAVTGDATSRTTYLWDNVNLPATVNFLAQKTISSDHDCCHKNYYFFRDTNKSGEWSALPWDFDLSLAHVWTSGNGGYFDDTTYTNLFVGVGNNNTLFALMWANPQLKEMWMRRTRTLMDQLLQPAGTATNADNLRARIDYYANLVRADATLDKVKWGGATWTVPVNGPANATTTNPTNNFETELSRMKDYYLPGRRTFLANNLTTYGIPNAQPTNVFINFGAIDYNPASTNQAQEYIELLNTNNFAVDLTGWKVRGAVDFTFAPGTTVTATNRIYLSPDVRAFRARTTGPRAGQSMFAVGPYGGQLSARGETLVLVNTSGQTNSSLTYVGAPSLAQQYLRITEIMYHPPDPGVGSPYGREEFEYIELKNIGPVALNLTGVHFTNGIDFVFNNTTVTNLPNLATLPAGSTLVLAKNLAAFNSRYPGLTNVTGPFIGTLDNNGENIRLDDAVGEKILDFTYNNTWYPMTDGNGLSLVIVNENAPFNTWGDKASWRASVEFNGTPGGPSVPPLAFAGILVNEVLTHTDLPAVDAIELYNPTTNAVDIGNWRISDDFFSPQKFRIPAPTILPAGGFIVFTEADFNVGPNAFSFSSKGDEAYLFSADAAGLPNGYYHGFGFDGAENGVSFGRYTNSQGDIHFVAQSGNTLGSANALPKIGPVIISEIMFHPPDVLSGTNLFDNTDDEYVELQNLTTNAVPLYDVAFPTNRWKLTDGINYVFSTNDVVPANGFIVVVSFNPFTNAPALANFRARYSVPTNVAIVGPFSGQLDNSDDKVELYRPDAPDAVSVPFILVERVHYSDLPPWPTLADGFGPALLRLVAGAYGNDPTNWTAAVPSPGSAPAAGAAPVFTTQPANALPFVGGTTSFTVVVSGDSVTVQWLRNGVTIQGATNATLVLSNVQFAQAGTYSAVAFNPAGSAVSSNATLNVITPVFFSLQPASQGVLPGTNVTINSLAVGTGLVRYQWRFEGTNLPNATNASYSFTGANVTNHHGNFSVVAMDDVSTVTSSNAFIFVLIKPGVTVPIMTNTVLQGGNVTLSVTATGAPPLTYRWLRQGAAFATSTVPFVTVTNVQAGGRYQVVVTNLAGSSAASPGAGITNVFVLADLDHDGVADVWELQYGFSTNNAADALLDFDGDGMSNRDEYLAGTNPTNALSVLKIVLSATNATVLNFTAQSNISYTVQWRTNLVAPAWSNLTSITALPLVRTVLVNTATAPAGSERYLRIITPQVP